MAQNDHYRQLNSLDVTWQKAERSGSDNACLEFAEGRQAGMDKVLLRDTKDHGTGPVFELNRASAEALLAAAKAGELDSLLS